MHATTEMASGLFKELTARTDTNFVCLAMYPEKEGVTIPTADDLKQAINAAKQAKVEAYVDNVKNEPLVPVLPKKGKIYKRRAKPILVILVGLYLMVHVYSLSKPTLMTLT